MSDRVLYDNILIDKYGNNDILLSNLPACRAVIVLPVTEVRNVGDHPVIDLGKSEALVRRAGYCLQ